MQFRLSKFACLLTVLVCTFANAETLSPVVEGAVSPASSPAVTTETKVCSHVAAPDATAHLKTPSGVPDLAGRITDTTGVITDACSSALTSRLADLESTTGVQLAVLLVGSTGEQTIEEYAAAVFEKWKLGQGTKDNGVLLVAALGDRHVRIEIGYGLEGSIPDVVAADVIRERIVPAFRSRGFERGISDAVGDLSQRLEDETEEIVRRAQAVQAERALRPRNPDSPVFWLALLLANVVFGAVVAWRRVTWKIFLPMSYLGSSAALIFGLPAGALNGGDPGGTLLAALMLPILSGVMPCGLGFGLVRSSRLRIWAASIAAVTVLLLAIGLAMGFSIGDVLGAICMVVLIVARFSGASDFGGNSTSSQSRSSSSSGWSSNSGSSSRSSGRFSGGGGKSGGGGASGGW